MAGPIWIDDPAIGNALAGLAEQFGAGKQMQYALTAEQIWKLRQERERTRKQMEAADTASTAEAARQGNLQPPTPGQTRWAISGGPISSEVVPPGGPAPLQPYDTNVRKEDTDAKRTFDLQRAKDIATFNLGAQHATSMSDVAGAAPVMQAQSTIAEYGWPTGQGTPAQNALLTALGKAPEKPVNPFQDAAATNLALEQAAVQLRNGTLNPANAPLIKSLLDQKYATELKPGGEGQPPYTIQQPMTPRDAELYKAVTPKSAVPPPPPAATTAPPAPPPPAQQAAPATNGQGSVSNVATAPPSTPPPTEAVKPPPAPPPAPPAPPQGLAAAGRIAPAGDPLTPKQPTETQAKAGLAKSMVMPDWIRLAKLAGANPTTGAPIDPAAGYTYQPTTLGGATQRAFGDVPLLSGAGQVVENLMGGDPTKVVQFSTASHAIAENIVRFISGAQINPGEYRSYYYLYTPFPTDPPEVVAEKFQRVATWTQAIDQAMTPAQAAQIAARNLPPGDPSVVAAQEIQSKNPQAAQTPYQRTQGGPAVPGAQPAPAGAETPQQRALRIRKELGL